MKVGNPYLQRTELDLFESLLYFSEAKVCVEIGVAYGDATVRLCRAIAKNGGTVFGFDIWNRHGLQGQFKSFSTKEEVEARIKKEGWENFILTKVDTRNEKERFQKELDKLCPNGIDFAFIDGCHSYLGVKNDFCIVYPRLTAAGIIAFHDTLFIDGCREFVLDLRTKFFDGTYDIINFPCGRQKGFNVGITLLVKRSYPKLDIPITEVCGSPSKPEEIERDEVHWLGQQLSGKKAAHQLALSDNTDGCALDFMGEDRNRKKFEVFKDPKK